MPTTSLGITYPASTGHARMWEHFQALADSVNDLITSGRVSGSRIATQLVTGDSGSVTTTETSIGSITAPLVAGRIYRIRYVTRVGTTASGDRAFVRIREDTVSGSELVGDSWYLVNPGAAGTPCSMEGEYTAPATGNKTFHLTLQRDVGTGTLRREGSFMPTYIYVDYIRG
ncbi:hypothetical protein OG994_16600 [Micromonospora globbae]|uniref:Uncharacterized protein n=1 Tax=Micromonospora globbae TaxID=1894969 RepID=A0ABZ1RYL7_9ACTN|nr:hypothetical protein [Micromonospora globbae]